MGNEKNPCSEEQGRIYRGTTLVTALLPSLEIVNADLRRNILFYSTAEPVSFEETRETEKSERNGKIASLSAGRQTAAETVSKEEICGFSQDNTKLSHQAASL